MNYELYHDDLVNPIFIGKFDALPEFRPRVGDQISLPNDVRIFKISRADPSDNPDDQKVIYYVDKYVNNQTAQFNIMIQSIPNNVPSL